MTTPYSDEDDYDYDDTFPRDEYAPRTPPRTMRRPDEPIALYAAIPIVDDEFKTPEKPTRRVLPPAPSRRTAFRAVPQAPGAKRMIRFAEDDDGAELEKKARVLSHEPLVGDDGFVIWMAGSILEEVDATADVKRADAVLSAACRVLASTETPSLQSIADIGKVLKWREMLNDFTRCARGYIRELWKGIQCQLNTPDCRVSIPLEIIVAAVDILDSPLEHKNIVSCAIEMLTNREPAQIPTGWKNTQASTSAIARMLSMLQSKIDFRLRCYRVYQHLK